MKNRMITAVIILMVVIGLSLLLYPPLSNYMNSLSYRRDIDAYNAGVEQLDDETCDSLLAAAREYNRRLAEQGVFTTFMSNEKREEYNSLLNVGGAGVMGYVSIPKADIVLPFYHGTDDDALQNGAGHLEGTSLPIGGESTHAVLTGHTGLTSAKLFTDIDRLVEGDTFTIHVLREVLTYEVDQILVVLPHETEALLIEEGQDYCTLLTCTPYGVNSHRLLVRGHRIETPEDTLPQTGYGAALTVILLMLVILLIVIVLIRRRGKRYQPKHLTQE